MFLIFWEEKLITVLMLSFLGLGILIRVLQGAVYQRMIKETDNMAATRNRLLKQCKVKFSNCYQLNNGVQNIPVFVDKFLNRMALGPISFQTLYHLSGQSMLLSVVCSGVGICKSIMQGRMLGEILPFYIVSFMGLYLYFSISTVVDVKGKRRVLKVNLVDYLENHLSARIQVTEQDLDMLYGSDRSLKETSGMGERMQKQGRNGARNPYQDDYGKRTVEIVPIRNRAVRSEEQIAQTARIRPEEMRSGKGRHMGSEQEKELENLLREFLAT